MKYWRTLLGLVLAVALIGLLLRDRVSSNPVVATIEVGPLPNSMAVDEATGRVFVSTVAKLGTVVVLDGSSGAKVHTTPLGARQDESGVDVRAIYLDPHGVKPLTVTLPDGALVALNSTTGAVLKRWPAHWARTPWPIGGHPAHGLVWAGTDAVLVEDVATRKVLGRVPLGQDSADYGAANQIQRFYLSSPTGGLSTVDAYRGVVLHTIQTGAPYYPRFAVSVSARHLFVFSDTDTLVMVDSMTGRVLRTIRAAVGAPPTAYSIQYSLAFEVSPEGDQLWVTNPARQTLSVFATTSGALLFTSRVDATPMAIAADPSHRHLLVLCRGAIDGAGDVLTYGSVSVLDTRTGRVERTIQVGAAPIAIAIDSRTSRAFVLNENVDADLMPVHLPHQQGAGVRIPAGLRGWIPFLPAEQLTSVANELGSVTVLDTNRL